MIISYVLNMPDDKVLAKYVLGFLHLGYGDIRIAHTA
jgi:hypothetical protein